MFDDLETAETRIEQRQYRSDEDDVQSSNIYRWAHFPALLVLGLLMIPLHGYRWGWEAAIAGAFTVFVYFYGFGQVLRDADDFFGDPRVVRFAADLFIPHLLVLAVLVPAVWLWFHLKPDLPEWITQEGRKGSLWQLFGWLVLTVAGIAEGSWMAGRIKRRFRESRD